MVHYYDHIKNFGSPNGLCLSIMESKHIVAVKCPWRRTNKHAALPQILKVNERLDKLATTRADFVAHGMLMDSCLVQAFRTSVVVEDHEEAVDKDPSDSDESDTSDEIYVSNPNHPTPPPPDNIDAYSPDDMDTHIPSNTDEPTPANICTPGIDDDDPHSSNQDSLALPNDEEDNSHGPVESSPLMNKVRLACKKGQTLLSQEAYKY